MARDDEVLLRIQLDEKGDTPNPADPDDKGDPIPAGEHPLYTGSPLLGDTTPETHLDRQNRKMLERLQLAQLSHLETRKLLRENAPVTDESASIPLGEPVDDADIRRKKNDDRARDLAALSKFEEKQAELAEQQRREQRPTLAEATEDFLPEDAKGLIGQALGNVTGSGTLGAIGGEFLGSRLGAAGGIGALAAFIGNELNDAISGAVTTRIDSALQSIFQNSEGLAVGASLAKAPTALIDPVETVTGINTNPIDNVITGFIDSITAATEALRGMAEDLGKFSPEIATATVEERVAYIERDLQRADLLGPDLAEFIRNRTEANIAIDELKTVILVKILPLIVSLSGHAANIARWVSAAGQELLDKVPTAEEFELLFPEVKMIRVINDSVKSVIPFLRRIDERMAKDDDPSSLRDELFKFLDPDRFREEIR